jgi:hypothetical protein
VTADLRETASDDGKSFRGRPAGGQQRRRQRRQAEELTMGGQSTTPGNTNRRHRVTRRAKQPERSESAPAAPYRAPATPFFSPLPQLPSSLPHTIPACLLTVQALSSRSQLPPTRPSVTRRCPAAMAVRTINCSPYRLLLLATMYAWEVARSLSVTSDQTGWDHAISKCKKVCL